MNPTNGKGSAQRPTNTQSYESNYDLIFNRAGTGAEELRLSKGKTGQGASGTGVPSSAPDPDATAWPFPSPSCGEL